MLLREKKTYRVTPAFLEFLDEKSTSGEGFEHGDVFFHYHRLEVEKEDNNYTLYFKVNQLKNALGGSTGIATIKVVESSANGITIECIYKVRSVFLYSSIAFAIIVFLPVVLTENVISELVFSLIVWGFVALITIIDFNVFKKNIEKLIGKYGAVCEH
jgi:hypothetical protein